MQILAQDAAFQETKDLIVKYEVDVADKLKGELVLNDKSILVKDLKHLVARQVNLAAKRLVINIETDSLSISLG